MSPTAEDKSTKREVQVEIPADVVARETDSVIQKMARVARLPGFRRGKVPPSVVRQRFAEEIKSEVVDSLVPRFFRQETEKQGLVPVSQPRVTDLHIHDGEPLRFKASFEVLPEIELAGYDDIRIERPDTSVKDEEIEQSLNNLREQQASYAAIENRPLADGDFAQVSFEGVPKNSAGAPETAPAPVESKPVTVDDVMVEIGGANTVRDFSDNLRGAAPGETRTFEVNYPAEFADRRLAGKTFQYTVQIKGVKQKQLPELNDEFAKSVGSFATLDDLKKTIRESLEHDKQHSAEHEGKEKLLDELVKRHAFEVPDSLVDHQVDVRLERGLRALAAQGMKAEDMRRMDFERLRAGQRDAAAREVKADLLLERIADKEQIQVSDEDIDSEIKAVAQQAQQAEESVRARLSKDGALERIRRRLRNEKTLEHLYRKSA